MTVTAATVGAPATHPFKQPGRREASPRTRPEADVSAAPALPAPKSFADRLAERGVGYLTHEDINTLHRIDCEREGITWDGRPARKANSLCTAYDVFRRKAEHNGRGTGETSWLTLGRAYYGQDVVYDEESMRRKSTQLHNLCRTFERWGALTLDVATKGTGKCVGLNFELLQVASVAASLRSSTG